MPRRPPTTKEFHAMAEEFCSSPEVVREMLRKQNKVGVFLSEDGTEIITEFPDGRVERKPLVPYAQRKSQAKRVGGHAMTQKAASSKAAATALRPAAVIGSPRSTAKRKRSRRLAARRTSKGRRTA